MRRPIQALILAGGLGTRLGPVSGGLPKPMLEVAGRPFIEHLFDQAEREGVWEILVACAHLGHVIEEAYHDVGWGDARISCVVEDAQTGTGGAVLAAILKLRETFYVLNGDSILQSGWGAVADALDDRGTLAAMALVEVGEASRYGSVRVDEAGRVVGFEEKGATGPALVNAGVYAMKKDSMTGLSDMPKISLETDVFPALAARGALAGVRCAGAFVDIGVPEDLEASRNAGWIGAGAA